MKKPLFIALFFLLQLPIFGQQTWTLERCIQYAKTNNIELQQSRLQTEFAEIDLKQSRFNRYPSINGQLSPRINFGRFINPITNTFTETSTTTLFVGLNASIDLFTGFRLLRSIEKSELQLQNTLVQNQVTENNMSLRIISAYLDILQAEEQIKILQEQSLVTKAQKDRTSKLIRAGVLPQGDILNIEAQIANEELTIVNAENVAELARLNLAQILDYYDQPIQVVSPEIDPPSENELALLNVNKIYTQALKKFPEVKSIELQKQIAEKDVAIAKSGLYPNVSLSAGTSSNWSGAAKIPDGFVALPPSPTGDFLIVNTGTGVDTLYTLSIGAMPTTENLIPFGRQIQTNLSYNVGLSVSIPIFNKYQVRNNIARSELSYKNAQYQGELTKRNLLQSIQQAYQAAVAASKSYEVNQRNIESLTQAFKNMEKKYELGLATALELSTAQNQLSVARINLNASKYEYLFRLKIIEFYQGKPLNLR